MGKSRWCLSQTELNWIVLALNHDIATLRSEAEHSDSDVVRSIGFTAIESREKLVTKITDMMDANVKKIDVS